MKNEKEKQYTITCNRSQLELISKACDFMSRIFCLQFDEIWHILSFYPYDMHLLEKSLVNLKIAFSYPTNFHHGILSDKIPDSARMLVDIHQVIRNKLAYEDNPDVTPENRWSKSKITVDFDEPGHYDSGNKLIKVE